MQHLVSVFSKSSSQELSLLDQVREGSWPMVSVLLEFSMLIRREEAFINCSSCAAHVTRLGVSAWALA